MSLRWERWMSLHSCIDIEWRLDYYSTVNSPALAIHFQSAASIDLSNCRSSCGRLYWNRKHGLISASAFIVRGCSRVCRVAVSHEEYCFLKGSQDCVTLNLTKSATVELKLCVNPEWRWLDLRVIVELRHNCLCYSWCVCTVKSGYLFQEF